MRQRSNNSILGLLIIFVLSSFSSHAFSQWKKLYNYDYLKLKAVVAYNEGEYRKSIKQYSQLIKKGHSDADLYTGRARCYIQTGEYEKAIADFRHLIKNYPSNYTYYLNIASIEHKRNNPEGELKILTEAVQKNNNIRLLLARGDYYQKLSDYEKAFQDYYDAFLAVKMQNPNVAEKYEILESICKSLLDMYMIDSSRVILNYALEELEFDKSVTDPPYKGAYSMYAYKFDICRIRLQLVTDRYADALGICDDLITKSSPEDKASKHTGYYFGAIALMHLEDYSEALKYFRRARAISKYVGPIPYYEGECYYQLDKFGPASSKYEEISKVKNEYAGGMAYKALADYRHGRNDHVLSTLDSLIRQYPEKPEITFIKARALGVQGKEQEAYEALAASLQANFSDRDRILFGLSDLKTATRDLSGNTLLSRLNIHPGTKDNEAVAAAGLIHSPPYTGKEKRLALVMGNGIYENGGILANPENDAVDMAAVLSHLGFEVIVYENADQNTMKRAIDEFGYRLRHYDVGLFFYAGHGIQAKGINYLIPVDARINSESDVEFTCVDAGRILSRMEEARNRINIIILDACRDNPFERSWNRSARSRGLAKMDAPKGSIIAYATEPGNTASDGSGRNGLYTGVLLDEIQTPGIIIEKVFRIVRTKVLELSEEKQIPWESTSLTGDFFFLK